MSGDIAAHARNCGAVPYAYGLAYRAGRNSAYIKAANLGSPRSGLPVAGPYTWRHPARKATAEAILEAVRADPDANRLLADAWDEPYEPAAADFCEAGRQARSATRRERIESLAAMPIWHGRATAPDGYVTARQAAEQLGVSTRVIERYKRELRGQEAS